MGKNSLLIWSIFYLFICEIQPVTSCQDSNPFLIKMSGGIYICCHHNEAPLLFLMKELLGWCNSVFFSAHCSIIRLIKSPNEQYCAFSSTLKYFVLVSNRSIPASSSHDGQVTCAQVAILYEELWMAKAIPQCFSTSLQCVVCVQLQETGHFPLLIKTFVQGMSHLN